METAPATPIPEAQVPPPTNGPNVFVDLFGQIDAAVILTLASGFAFLALLLAAVLISMSIIRGRTDPHTRRLISQFLIVATLFVVATLAADFLRPRPPTAVTLTVYPIEMRNRGDEFPIYVGLDGTEKNILKERYEATVSNTRIFISINATAVASILEDHKRALNESLQKIENLASSAPGLGQPQAINEGG